MTSRKATLRIGLAAVLVLSVLGVSMAVASVGAAPADAGTGPAQVDDVAANEDCPLCIEPPTAPCDATCVDLPPPPEEE